MITTSASKAPSSRGDTIAWQNNAASPYTILLTDYYLGVDCSGGAVELDLPVAATAGAGRVYIIKDESGDSAANTITIDPDGTEQIDEAGAGTPATITAAHGSLTLITDGSNWFII